MYEMVLSVKYNFIDNQYYYFFVDPTINDSQLKDHQDDESKHQRRHSSRLRRRTLVSRPSRTRRTLRNVVDNGESAPGITRPNVNVTILKRPYQGYALQLKRFFITASLMLVAMESGKTF